MSESFVPEAAERAGITLASLSDPVGMVKSLHALAWKLDETVKKAVAASVATESTPKVVALYDATAKADQKAEATAKQIIARILASVEKAVTANPNVAYWLSEQDKVIASFHTSEVNYLRWMADQAAGVKAVRSPDSSASVKADRKAVIQFTQKVASLVPTVLDGLPAEMVKTNKAGVKVVNLPNIQGRQSGTADESQSVGKYGRLSHMVWTVGDETFPEGTDSRIILRTIFTGASRIGVRPGNLYDAFQAAQDKDLGHMIKAGEKVTFKLNDKNVTATFGSEPESDEDEESEDESSE